MGARKNDITDAAANLARAQEPEAARLQPQEELEDKEQEGNLTKSSMVPVADMGVPGKYPFLSLCLQPCAIYL